MLLLEVGVDVVVGIPDKALDELAVVVVGVYGAIVVAAKPTPEGPKLTSSAATSTVTGEAPGPIT